MRTNAAMRGSCAAWGPLSTSTRNTPEWQFVVWARLPILNYLSAFVSVGGEIPWLAQAIVTEATLIVALAIHCKRQPMKVIRNVNLNVIESFLLSANIVLIGLGCVYTVLKDGNELAGAAAIDAVMIVTVLSPLSCFLFGWAQRTCQRLSGAKPEASSLNSDVRPTKV